MKILYITQFYFPERVAAAFRATDNTRIWASDGAEVSVFTAYPNFPTGKIFNEYTNKLLSVTIIDKVRIFRSKILAQENTSKIKRGIISLSFAFYGIINILFNRKKIGKDYDLVLGTSGTIFTPIIAYLFSIINKIPFVLEIRDITYMQMLAVYSGKKTLLYKIIKKLELFLCKKAKKIIVVTNGFKEKLVKDGINENKIEVIPNGVLIDEDNIALDNIIDNCNKKKLTLTYMGNLGKSQNLKNIVLFFKSLQIKYRQKSLILIGDGAVKEELKEFIEKNNIEDVIIIDGMSQEELKKYYEISDFCIVSLINSEFFKDTIPSKIFHIMGKSKPILYFGPDGEAANIIKKAKSGILFYKDDFVRTAEMLSNIINTLDERGTYLKVVNNFGNNGYRYIKKHFDRERLAKSYLNILDVLTFSEK